jgi:t-SNARE complex subunit (syntaxin)
MVSARKARNKRKWCFVLFLVILLVAAGVVVFVLYKNGKAFYFLFQR